MKNILNVQNNKFPYLFIDKIFDIVPLSKGSGKKCFTSSEWFFGKEGNNICVPNYVLIECLVQIVVITIQSHNTFCKKELNDIRFKEILFIDTIEAGEVLICECSIIRVVRGIVYAESNGFNNGKLICSMKVEIAVLEEFNKYLPAN